MTEVSSRHRAALSAASARAKYSDKLHEEILWLRTFGWDAISIARRLRVSESCVEKHLARAAEDGELD